MPLTEAIRHAITPPSFDRTKLHRARLVDAIHAAIERKLIAIVAPPGYGKTTLLADFIAHTDFPACWAKLSQEDMDPRHLAELIGASLQRRFRRLRKAWNWDQIGQLPPRGLGRVLLDAVRERVPEPAMIILDDIQVIRDSEGSQELLDTLLLESPDNLTFIIAGRELPGLSVGRLVMDAQMAGFGAHDLALTFDELIALDTHSLHGSLTAERAQAMLQESRGWIAAVLLSSQLPQKVWPAPTQERSLLYTYLATEVFNRLPEQIQAFLLDAAVLPVMTAASCDLLMGRQDSGRILAKLYRTGTFLSATETSPRTYEFHALFRRFLLDIAADRDPTRLHRLQTAGARLLEDQGSVAEAVDLYQQAGDARAAARLAERHAREFLASGRINMLNTWAETFTSQGIPAPSVHLVMATHYTDRGDLEQARSHLDQALGQIPHAPARDRPRLQAHAESVRGWMALRRGDYEDVLKAAEGIERTLPKRGAKIRRASVYRLRALALYHSAIDWEEAEGLLGLAAQWLREAGDEFTLGHVYLDLVMVQDDLGKRYEAIASLERAHRILERTGSPFGLGSVMNAHLIEAHRRGEFERAIQFFEEGRRQAHRAASPLAQTFLLYSLADMYNDVGMASASGDLYGEGLTLASRLENRRVLHYGCLGTAILHRRHGTPRAALEWLERASNHCEGLLPLSHRIQTAALRLQADPESSARELASMLELPASGMPARQRVQAAYFLALAHLHLGNSGSARRDFMRALDLAAISGDEQTLAAEIQVDPDVRRFMEEQGITHPSLEAVDRRIALMRLFAARATLAPSPPERKAIILRGLGSFAIMLGDAPCDSLEPLHRQVLFYLAEFSPVPRDVLLEDIWPGATQGSQAASLHTTTHALRAALGEDILEIEAGLYRLNPGLEILYDVAEFDRLCGLVEAMPHGDPRRIFALREAVRAYRGDFLPSCAAEWALRRRDSLQRQYLKLLEAAAQEALNAGMDDEALDYLREAVRLEPLRDDLNIRLLEVLGATGRRHEVVAQYRSYRQRLADELGLEPPPEARRLYERLIQ